MGNAPEKVIEAASELTATVHDDGLAQVLATLDFTALPSRR
jgi:hydroxymethylpyrimidine pyrophosphatase-like HAD family hydrolase